MHRLPLWTAAMLTALAGQASAGSPELGECAALDDDSARLVCYDKLAGRGPAAAAATVDAAGEADGNGDANYIPPRLYQEEANATNRFVIIPYERNYLLPVTYNSNINEEAWHIAHPGTGMDQAEVKFQISMKAIIWQDILGRDLDLWGAYTQTSWMQAYNTDASSPFPGNRLHAGTDPEFRQQLEGAGFSQHPDQCPPQSRVQRPVGTPVAQLEPGDPVGPVRAQELFPARPAPGTAFRSAARTTTTRTSMTTWATASCRVCGNGPGTAWALPCATTCRSDNKGAIQLDWTFPISQRFSGYIQYFNGYGESLIDYDESTNRIGIGVSLTDPF